MTCSVGTFSAFRADIVSLVELELELDGMWNGNGMEVEVGRNTVVGEGGVVARNTTAGQGNEARRVRATTKQRIQAHQRGPKLSLCHNKRHAH
jgi:hypothetical protein